MEEKKFRVESDLLGELQVPKEAYYGVQTQLADQSKRLLHVLFTETSIIQSVLTKVLRLKEKSKVRLMGITLHQTLVIQE